MYVHMYVCMCMYARMYVHKYVCMHVIIKCMHATYTCVHIHICMHAYLILSGPFALHATKIYPIVAIALSWVIFTQALEIKA